MAKKVVLGRGLGALIDDAEPKKGRNESPGQEAERNEVPSSTGSKLIDEIDLDSITANPYQPRTVFDQEALEELADSIKTLGIIQPLTVREVDDGYQLISGERRLRAARIAGLKKIPAFIRTANDQGMLEMALVENIQRSDLNAIEVALSYQRLIEECDLTHETLSERVAKKRTTITNYLRLLRLPAEIQLAIKERKLSMGHARAIIAIEDPIAQLKVFRTIIQKDLSVRATEELVRKQSQSKETKDESNEKEQAAADTPGMNDYQNKLNHWFGWGAEIKSSPKGNGKIVISYRNQNELEEIIEKLKRVEE